ncbi:MAG: Fis family transcriptional regulator [Cyanobacteriota bacterium erpe_2018_sw_21hr_WHONDRS-SW48-000092_B_bin.40]|nr:Fis family transcriptional regulator [Cyanobacteriota bacterium erpe_2018_sw_21hr_WHONDRS-SW48-000092_B_bin.40]
MTLTPLRDLVNGVCSHPIKLFICAFTAFSVLQTLGSGITYFAPGVKFDHPWALPVVGGISLLWAIKKLWKPSTIEINVPNCNTVIEITFGDLFKQTGIRVIAVNEFFDSEIGKPVSDKSIHGKLIQTVFAGHPESFDKLVLDALEGKSAEEIQAKVDGKKLRYPIGTTVLIAAAKEKYLLLAFSKTDPETCKASSTVTLMWDALHDLWQRVRIESGGHDVNLPLVGSGRSGLGLPTVDLLNLIILSAITETKSKPITDRIRIILPLDRFEKLDLRDVKAHWEAK